MIWLHLFLYSLSESPIATVKNYCKFSGLRQHPYVTVSVGQMSRHSIAQLSSQDRNQGVSRFMSLSGDSGEESLSKFI